MDKKKKIYLIAGIIIIFFSVGVYFYSPKDIRPAPEPIGLSYVAEKETTVYDFMDKLRNEGKINFTEKNYTGIGKFIESINGVKGHGEQNWIYYVNGKKAQIGVSNYKLKPGDVVSWKYEKLLSY